MLQDTHTPSSQSESFANEDSTPARPLRRSPEASQFSADTYADRLMDDLFQDVEQLLDMGPPPLSKPVSPEPVPSVEIPSGSALQPFPPTEVRQEMQPAERAMPLAQRPDGGTLQTLPHSDSLVQMPAAIASEPAAPTTFQTTKPSGFGRLWLATGGVAIVVSLALWLLYQDGKQQQQAMSLATAGAGTAQTATNQQFADYLQKSLQQIDQQAQQAGGLAPGQGQSASAPGLPTVVIPKTDVPSLPSGNVPSTTNPATGAQRVYVPVYKIPSNLYPPGAGVAPLPTLPNQKPTPPLSAASNRPTATTPSVPRKLVGVLEQGNNSVALFEINGVTQRYEMGESIGSSGWTLVEVSKNQAIIRRNGDVRSLFVGHSF
ncbi:MAG: hypothetical protein NW220_09950 [Leptolyngbyaceae cyanobacterium bins.349]|nr:hypothetical protein [Leptolyngbyaceae cyanobacterium bins.349]